MFIPNTERIVFKNNPLKQVICQLRFPPILRIDTELPAEFQERIRQIYPLLEERTEASGIPPQEISQLLSPSLVETMAAVNKFYDFRSESGMQVVTLNKGFLALTSGKYYQWEDFKSHLLDPLDALLKVYKPPFFSRIGLRYQNIIKRSELSLKEVSWAKLLQPYIVGLLSETTNLSEELILESQHSEVISLDGSQTNMVRIQHGLVKDETGEFCYLIDNDFFVNERVDLEDADTKLGYLHKQSGRFFHWCITERLRAAMEPTNIK